MEARLVFAWWGGTYLGWLAQSETSEEESLLDSRC